MAQQQPHAQMKEPHPPHGVTLRTLCARASWQSALQQQLHHRHQHKQQHPCHCGCFAVAQLVVQEGHHCHQHQHQQRPRCCSCFAVAQLVVQEGHAGFRSGCLEVAQLELEEGHVSGPAWWKGVVWVCGCRKRGVAFRLAPHALLPHVHPWIACGWGYGCRKRGEGGCLGRRVLQSWGQETGVHEGGCLAAELSRERASWAPSSSVCVRSRDQALADWCAAPGDWP